MKISISELRRIIREVVAEVEMTESEGKEDLNKDGKNDFADVMIARRIASGETKSDAVKHGTADAKKAMKKKK